MNARTAVSLFLFGTALLIAGGLFKIQHWPMASIQLVLGAVLQSIALVALAIKVARYSSFQGFLGS